MSVGKRKEYAAMTTTIKDAIATHVDYRPNVADTANRKAA